MHKALLVFAATVVGSVPLLRQSTPPNTAPTPAAPAAKTCVRARPEANTIGLYPEHPLSPLESLRQYDAVFLAEVAVPARRCSLGWCAGLKLLRGVKGASAPTVLVRAEAANTGCPPENFTAKGSRWVVFANQGTSQGGMQYLQATDDGPTFAAQDLPDFNELELLYRQERAALDEAIAARTGKLR